MHYYKSDNELLLRLTEYIGTGLLHSDTCLVIASRLHIELLNNRLLELGVNVDGAYSRGNYITLDAKTTINSFVVNGLPDEGLFYDTVGKLVADLAVKGAPVRAFGEMVALLWKVGNKKAVMELERAWNGLAEKNTFSHYCAYPDLHFVMDLAARQEINEYHTLHLPTLLPI